MLPTQELTDWALGIGGGKAVNLLANYLETENPDLAAYYFKELVGIGGGIAAVAFAWKSARLSPRNATRIGLLGMEMFIDRIVNFAASFAGIPVGRMGAPPRRAGILPGYAPAPGLGRMGQYPLVTYPRTSQRLPFQTDMTW